MRDLDVPYLNTKNIAHRQSKIAEANIMELDDDNQSDAKNDTKKAKNDTKKARNDAKKAKNDTKKAKNDTKMDRNESQEKWSHIGDSPQQLNTVLDFMGCLMLRLNP